MVANGAPVVFVAVKVTVPVPEAQEGWSELIPLIWRLEGSQEGESEMWGVMCSLAPLSSTHVVEARRAE